MCRPFVAHGISHGSPKDRPCMGRLWIFRGSFIGHPRVILLAHGSESVPKWTPETMKMIKSDICRHHSCFSTFFFLFYGVACFGVFSYDDRYTLSFHFL